MRRAIEFYHAASLASEAARAARRTALHLRAMNMLFEGLKETDGDQA